jgi:hypothetical protein
VDSVYLWQYKLLLQFPSRLLILTQINQAKYVYKEIIKTLKIEEDEKRFLDSRVEEAF